jgi:hypothetical protein
MNDNQFARLMQVLTRIAVALENKTAPSNPKFTEAQKQMAKDMGGYNLEYPGDFVEAPREQGAEGGLG